MSYALDPEVGYRMPTHFGPLPGPRWDPEGGWRAICEDQRTISLWATFEADGEAVGALLPLGFEPTARPDLTVELKNMSDIDWLGGRGYSVATVTTSVHRTDPIDEYPTSGQFKLILWENHADPIITGRDELGYPKVFAEIDTIELRGNAASSSASWDGFTFLELSVDELMAGTAAPPGGHSFHTRYVPRVGAARGHDLIQSIVTLPGQGPIEVVKQLAGVGTLKFNRGSFQQLPTLVNVVSALASIRIGACRSAGLISSRGSGDYRNQVVLSEQYPPALTLG
jgi:Acetoacetate decarboxylase (ADC)